ncbi:MAG: hypothetical protein P3W97_005765 [Tepidimonas sp.]|uniref:hypothetical protein n=1 Tax=Tepidimonas sp. TaxID=2002775 RepID=UPI00259DCE34|nr:hypothetical protein [Tepidimonas sp.]MDM7456756.1 hypothetical protein [Tepidimonas sp.]
MDDLQIARIARLADAPNVAGAGVDLAVKLGESVRAGDVLYQVYAAYPADVEFARAASMRASGYTIGAPHEAVQIEAEF